ncbi:MAG: DUF6473 family protein [Pseudomonadota bacterium]
MPINPISHSDTDEELDYCLTTPKGSRLQLRGPLPTIDKRFIAVLGGSETFGRYVRDPFPTLLSDWVDVPVANLGVPYAGLSLFSDEKILLDISSRAEVTVLQILGAQNMSNRLYRVHSRRNDRFIGASPALQSLFPSVDFAEINFTGHLLNRLRETSEDGFQVVVDELKWAWVQRMRRLLKLIGRDVILLWISAQVSDVGGSAEPHFVDRKMLENACDDPCEVVEVALKGPVSLKGKLFPAQEADAALKMPGSADHRRIAESLAPLVRARFGQGRTNRTAPPQVRVSR